MKDHEIAELVNNLKDIALEHHDKQCLRQLISKTINEALKPTTKKTKP